MLGVFARFSPVPLAGPLLLLAALCAGCERSAPMPNDDSRERPAATSAPAIRPSGDRDMPMTLKSPAFDNGQPIPQENTGDGRDLSPQLSWDGVPAAAVELALICEDPDAPRPQPWVHWVIYKLSPNDAGLPPGVPPRSVLDVPHRALQGKSDWGKIGYRGPAPPRGHGVHHYHFKLYALDITLDVPPGLTKAELLSVMQGHIVAECELVGTYER